MNLNATIFVQALWFALLIWFAVKFIWPPLTTAIASRNKKIADGLAAAEQGKLALVEAERKGDAAMREARDRASELKLTTEKQATDIIEAAKAQAKVEADKIIAAAHAAIEQEASKARNALRDQVATLAVAGAEKILKREVDARAHAQMLDELKAQL
jgi:F-type H+-transporting ATPase subunit b